MRSFFLIWFTLLLLLSPLSFPFHLMSVRPGEALDLWLVLRLLVSGLLLIWLGVRKKLFPSARERAGFIIFVGLLVTVSLAGEHAVNATEFVRLIFLVVFALFLLVLKRLFRFPVVFICVIAVLTLQAQWALAQFIFQQDFGLQYLGETNLQVGEPGIATFSSASTKVIRAYGPYQHPNALGGSVIFGLVLYLIAAGKNIARHSYLNFFLPALFALMAALMATFSRSAYLAAFLALLTAIAWRAPNTLPKFRSTILSWSPTRLTPFLVLLVLFVPLLIGRFGDKADVAGVERFRGIAWASEIIATYPWWQGAGPGNYTLALEAYFDRLKIPYLPWEIAPVHSVPFLLISEWGAAAVALAAMAMVLGLRRMGATCLWLLPLLPLLLFDHYLATVTAPALYLITLLVFLPQAVGSVPYFRARAEK